jgi:glycosyltransferase involved in cell wall biosynthesis
VTSRLRDVSGRSWASLARVALDPDSGSLAVPPSKERRLLIAFHGDTVVGEVLLSDAGAPKVAAAIGERVRRRRLIADFRRATRAACSAADAARLPPSVSVILTTRDRPHDLRGSLESVMRLRTRPEEVVVVDCSEDGGQSRAVTRDFPVRYLAEPGAGLTEARNGAVARVASELVAFVEDDCEVEPGWLDGLDGPFGDPMLAVVGTYVGPKEFATRGQWLFDAREASRRRFDHERLVFGSAALGAVSYRNAICRRTALVESGLFAADLGPGTPARSGDAMDLTYRLLASGHSILIDPGRVGWHRHPDDVTAVERALLQDLIGGLAAASRCLLTYRDVVSAGAMVASAVSATLVAARGLERRERGARRRVIGGTLRRGAREGGPLVRAVAQCSRDGRSQAVHGAPRPHLETPVSRGRGDARLTVVVPTYNRREHLRRVLAALSRQSYPAERFEVVVVVDGSTDGSAELVRSWETPYELRVFEQDNRGLAATRNRGALEAREELIVFLDDDLLPEHQFLAAHADAHSKPLGRHVVLGACPPAPAGRSFWGTYFRSIWGRHYRCKAQPHHRWTYADIVGGNCSLSRSLIVESGGWDERFVRREDWELGVRLLRAGASFAYRPEARAWHHSESTLSEELRKRQVEGRDDVYFASKHPHVRAQLPLAAYARVAGSMKTRLAFRYRRTGAVAVRTATSLANGLEILGLRRRWIQVVDLLLAHAYFLGAVEALGSVERLERFVAPVTDGSLVDTLEVVLGTQGCLEVPRMAGAIDLVVRPTGGPPVRIPALELEGQWDWEAIEERLLAAAPTGWR